MNWYIEVLKKYAVFDGRARRAEFWYFQLFNFIITLILAFATSAIKLPIISIVYYLAILIPSLAVNVRRLHDIDRSGWWLLIAFVPIIGFIILLIFDITDGTPGKNRFGDNPKETAPVA
ncbi:MAG: DUF805 domain-containing protein [Deltaproteobacteria bacterium]|nr:DUF805 domain-containing protein [Deltaproteobacteria bacterium]